MTITADTLSRTKKLLLDTGEVTDVDALDAAFQRYGVVVRYDSGQFADATRQIALLTVLNLAARTLDGQVQLEGCADTFSVPGFEGMTVEQAAAAFGALPGYKCSTEVPVVALSESASGIKLAASGWRAAAIGVGCTPPFVWDDPQPIAAIAAAALAMNEVFHVLRDDHPMAGKRVSGLSLWRPDMLTGWSQPDADGPARVAIEHPVLVLGLGHLGQAYLWAIAMQIREGLKPELWLQDDDMVTDSTWTTSMLTPRGSPRVRKSRLLGQAMEARGFSTRVVEQRLLSRGQFTSQTPRLVLYGVDNLQARRLISELPAVAIVEAGLGDGYDTFRGIRIHSFPSSQDSKEIWSERTQVERPLAPAYQALLAKTKDQCGTTTLAARSVGVPFVGCFAACLVLSEMLRRVHGGPSLSVQDVNLRSLDDRDVLVEAEID